MSNPGLKGCNPTVFSYLSGGQLLPTCLGVGESHFLPWRTENPAGSRPLTTGFDMPDLQDEVYMGCYNQVTGIAYKNICANVRLENWDTLPNVLENDRGKVQWDVQTQPNKQVIVNWLWWWEKRL